MTASLRPGRDSGWLKRLTERVVSNVAASEAKITMHSSSWMHDLDQVHTACFQHLAFRIQSQCSASSTLQCSEFARCMQTTGCRHLNLQSLIELLKQKEKMAQQVRCNTFVVITQQVTPSRKWGQCCEVMGWCEMGWRWGACRRGWCRQRTHSSRCTASARTAWPSTWTAATSCCHLSGGPCSRRWGSRPETSACRTLCDHTDLALPHQVLEMHIDLVQRCD